MQASNLIALDSNMKKYLCIVLGLCYVSSFSQLYDLAGEFKKVSKTGSIQYMAAFGYIPWLKLLLVFGAVQQLYIGISNFLEFITWKKVN